jgi:phosphotransferase system HPr (HPr) family protein
MNGETLQAKVTIVNPMGFHMRPMAAFARRAAEYAGSIAVVKEGQRVNGKSIFELMTLAAEQGAELTVEVSDDGPEAKGTLAALAIILAAPSMDDDLPPPKG